MIVEELIGLLGWKLEGEQDLKKFKSGMDDAEVSAKKTSDRVKALGIAAGAVATGAIALGTSAVKNYASFERAMLRIGNTAGASASETAKASDDVQALAKKFALPLDEAVAGLDTLTASGKDLNEAMAFLPTVLATTQGYGADARDIANAALKASSALRIEASEIEKTFDIMAVGGKAGQFELKDMASYIPVLANQFANLGYNGNEGLKRLIAVLQTLREDTGTAGQAANYAENLFSKMFSGEVERNFKKFGRNIREEMANATAAGEDAIDAYVRLTKEVLDQNPTARLSDIFVDIQLQNAMLSLTTSTDALRNFFDILNGTEVSGTVYRDVKQFTDDTTAAIQNMTNAWDSFMKSLGGSIAPSATSALNALTNEISYQDAVSKELEKQGYSFLGRQLWMGTKEQKDALARAGGYVPNNDPIAQEAARNAPEAYKVLGRRATRPISKTPDTAYGYNEPAQKEIPANVFAGFEARMDKLAAVATSTPPEVTNTVNDSRDQSVTVQVGGVTVQGVQNVNAAVGGAIGRAVGQAAVGRVSRFERDDAF
ncbi:phage tail tape measure protein [Agrobacterium sp. FDAARGOS_525]|uniref:phage tail tape measure protein n=1 Tax=Agrobacterium sp. FDAARGOS_525 TaxID=2420311 RepID=UPI000F67D746|nr:phage tail tape measure protein [Agrobacterium sp. FDAARGOS_525]RSC36405.1 phage tail tape measure protein [Agrobacterium sp. FDAARGOS_525]